MVQGVSKTKVSALVVQHPRIQVEPVSEPLLNPEPVQFQPAIVLRAYTQEHAPTLTTHGKLTLTHDVL